MDRFNRDYKKPLTTRGKEFLQTIPEASSGNTDRQDLTDRTQLFVEAHAGKLGKFIWGVALTDTGILIEPGFIPATEQ